jgi:hypothetical protein
LVVVWLWEQALELEPQKQMVRVLVKQVQRAHGRRMVSLPKAPWLAKHRLGRPRAGYHRR